MQILMTKITQQIMKTFSEPKKIEVNYLWPVIDIVYSCNSSWDSDF